MIELERPRALARLRRLALASQGLLHAQPFGRGLAAARQAINHLGYVQIDTISVVERAHHHVFHSRVPGFRPAMVDRLLADGEIFEYWAHAAAFLPICDYRFSLPAKHAIKNGRTHWYKNPDKKLMAELLARIRSDGPLRSRDLESATPRRAGWWDWKPAKRALEQLYMEGDLMVSGREGFQKTYDLTERVLPPEVDASMPCLEERATHLVDQQLRCNGFSTLKGLTYLRRDAELRKAVKAVVNERLAQRTLEQVRVRTGEVFLLESGALDRPIPRLQRRLQILSPFDNSVIQRERLRTLFEYDFQIECYLPAAKRQYGYFCLPLLFGDQFIGRMDCKAHRTSARFEIKSLYLELNDFDEDVVIKAFAEALGKFCRFQQCATASLTQAHPKYLTPRLRRALSS